jgi:hypothetical protein
MAQEWTNTQYNDQFYFNISVNGLAAVNEVHFYVATTGSNDVQCAFPCSEEREAVYLLLLIHPFQPVFFF